MKATDVCVLVTSTLSILSCETTYKSSDGRDIFFNEKIAEQRAELASLKLENRKRFIELHSRYDCKPMKLGSWPTIPMEPWCLTISTREEVESCADSSRAYTIILEKWTSCVQVLARSKKDEILKTEKTHFECIQSASSRCYSEHVTGFNPFMYGSLHTQCSTRTYVSDSSWQECYYELPETEWCKEDKYNSGCRNDYEDYALELSKWEKNVSIQAQNISQFRSNQFVEEINQKIEDYMRRVKIY
jgi:hypothetical protein